MLDTTEKLHRCLDNFLLPDELRYLAFVHLSAHLPDWYFLSPLSTKDGNRAPQRCFTKAVQEVARALTKNRCEECIREAYEQYQDTCLSYVPDDKALFVHHKLPLAHARAFPFLTNRAISSILNAQVLCGKHHQLADKQPINYEAVARYLYETYTQLAAKYGCPMHSIRRRH